MIPGVVLTAAIVGVIAHLAFDLSWTAALLMGAVLAPTDPAILIPLFVRSRLRPKVAQTVVAESAFNDPTGAVLALALAGVLLSGDSSLAAPAEEFVIDLVLGLDTRPAAEHDDLQETVDYGTLVDEVRSAVANDPVDLIETLAQRIADVCLLNALVEDVEVTVHKPHAPIQATFDDVALTIRRSRQ